MTTEAMNDPSILECGCKLFCLTHGREEVVIGYGDSEPSAYCNQCAADGWDAELCTPSADQCFSSGNADAANAWERAFMCPKHTAEHVAFCAEVAAEDAP